MTDKANMNLGRVPGGIPASTSVDLKLKEVGVDGEALIQRIIKDFQEDVGGPASAHRGFAERVVQGLVDGTLVGKKDSDLMSMGDDGVAGPAYKAGEIQIAHNARRYMSEGLQQDLKEIAKKLHP